MTSSRRGRPGLGAWWAPALVLLAGLLIVVVGARALLGGFVIGAAFLLAAALRLSLGEDSAGGLVVRSRAFDVVLWMSLGVLAVAAFAAADLHPLR